MCDCPDRTGREREGDFSATTESSEESGKRDEVEKQRVRLPTGNLHVNGVGFSHARDSSLEGAFTVAIANALKYPEIIRCTEVFLYDRFPVFPYLQRDC
jgi:hypothetical protein